MGSREDEPLLSVIAAVYNEEACLPELVARLDRALDGLRVELVLVDDGSTDRSFAVIEALAARDPRIRGVRLLHNEGHQTALMCGMACAHGDVVVTLDADLQHPPERIPEMLEAWKQGFDVVHMRRRDGHQGSLRAALSRAFYAVFNAVSETGVAPRSTDFRLVDRRCLRALFDAWNDKQFLRAAARSIGFRQTEIDFDPEPRFAGRPSYTLPKLFALATGAVIAATKARPVTGSGPARGRGLPH